MAKAQPPFDHLYVEVKVLSLLVSWQWHQSIPSVTLYSSTRSRPMVYFNNVFAIRIIKGDNNFLRFLTYRIGKR